MVFSFVKNSSTLQEKSSPMLSLSIFGSSQSPGSKKKKSLPTSPAASPSPKATRSNTSTTTTTTTSIITTSKFPQDAMKATGDARSEAITFLGLLRHNEGLLETRVKQLAKKDRQLVSDVFTCLIDEWTPLHACTLRGARKLVKLALKCGVNPDLEMGSPDGLPGRCGALHLAAYRGDVSLVQLLVSNGASLNMRDSTRRTPLYYATCKKNVLAARKLIKYGADVSDLTLEQREYYKQDIEGRPPSLLCIPVPFTGDSR